MELEELSLELGLDCNKLLVLLEGLHLNILVIIDRSTEFKNSLHLTPVL